jgi:hypothetical protein
VQATGRKYGSGPRSTEDMQINHHHGGRGFYYTCDDGHSWEVITHTYTTPSGFVPAGAGTTAST